MSNPERPARTDAAAATSASETASAPATGARPAQQAPATSRPATSTSRPAVSRDGVPMARVRRSPRVIPFLATGAVLGALVGFLIEANGGEGGNYTDSSSSGYLLLLGAVLGLMFGGIAFVLADRRS